MSAPVRNEIHAAGRRGVDALLGLIPALVKSDDVRAGDVMLDGRYIEVKATSRTSVAQVRAVKFTPLVVRQLARQEWYVLSAMDVVHVAASKARGQHTEIAFECMALHLPAPGGRGWRQWQRWRTEEQHLEERLRAALAEADRHPAIAQLMRSTQHAAASLQREVCDRLAWLAADVEDASGRSG